MTIGDSITWGSLSSTGNGWRGYNDQITSLVSQLEGEGLLVILVDMSNLLTSAGLADKKHPNDQGYSKMAQRWNDGILKAQELGFLSAPTDPSQTTGTGLGLEGARPSGSGGCGESNWRRVGDIADKVRTYRGVGTVAQDVSNATATNVLFADVNGK